MLALSDLQVWSSVCFCVSFTSDTTLGPLFKVSALSMTKVLALSDLQVWSSVCLCVHLTSDTSPGPLTKVIALSNLQVWSSVRLCVHRGRCSLCVIFRCGRLYACVCIGVDARPV